MRIASVHVPGTPPVVRKISTCFVASPTVQDGVARLPLMLPTLTADGAVMAATSIEPAGLPADGNAYADGCCSLAPVGRDWTRAQRRVFAGTARRCAVPDAVHNGLPSAPRRAAHAGSFAAGREPVPAGVIAYSTRTGSLFALSVNGMSRPPLVSASVPTVGATAVALAPTSRNSKSTEMPFSVRDVHSMRRVPPR